MSWYESGRWIFKNWYAKYLCSGRVGRDGVYDKEAKCIKWITEKYWGHWLWNVAYRLHEDLVKYTDAGYSPTGPDSVNLEWGSGIILDDLDGIS